MDFELYDKYGERNCDGYYITNHSKWDYFAQRPKLYKSKKRKAFLYLLIPFLGIIGADLIFEEMGLSSF